MGTIGKADVSKCLKVSSDDDDDVTKCQDVGGYCIFQKQREQMRTQRWSFMERSCLLYFQIICYHQVKLAIVCCHFQLPLKNFYSDETIICTLKSSQQLL